MKHFSILVCSFIIYISGCSLQGNATDEELKIPNGYIIIDHHKAKLQTGGFHLERKVGLETEVVTTDSASPNQIAETLEPIKVAPNSTLAFKTDIKESNITAIQWNDKEPEKEVKLEDNEFIAPVEQGEYIYEIISRWNNNEVSYTIVVKVE
ncbi:hypothetical protein [Litchfieldia salsa]|uniref:Uncharacterized protein n=1 Tax=Litchfieldia salsa TaxID=930152 RepID=A0A1H0PGW6_9BACI|nr:hypothetical protein [Litchfieldia salsa]SDP04010.1 hypothetical protein SAMN05216565_101304 [Litchfieldia salsa]